MTDNVIALRRAPACKSVEGHPKQLLPNHVLATLHPSLMARARELSIPAVDAEDLLSEAYERLCRADVEGRIPDPSPIKLQRWVRSTLLNIRRERLRLARRITLDPVELEAAGIL